MKVNAAFWHIVMLCKFISITGTCISPENDFPSAYVFILTVTTVAHIIRSIFGVLMLWKAYDPNNDDKRDLSGSYIYYLPLFSVF